MPDPQHFEQNVEAYERGRPPYPAALFDRLAVLGLLVPGHRALDVGAGTGLATGPLLDAGLRVTAVEPGPRLASALAARHPEAAVIVGSAESAELCDAAFDLAVAATSIHWLDLDVVLPALHRALKPGGSLLVWRTVFGDPDAPVTPFRERVFSIVAERPDPVEDRDPLGQDELLARIARDGLFSLRHFELFRWSIELDELHVRDLFATFSDWSPAEADAAAAAAQELGGLVTEHYVTPLAVFARV